MGMIVECRLKRTQLRLLSCQDGFSLIELMVAFIIVVVTLAGVSASFRNFTKHSGTSLSENENSSAIEATFQLLKRDLNMAGFGLAPECRLAEDDQFETAIESDFISTYDCDGDGSSDDPISETCYDYDFDGDGSLHTAGSLMYRDRLFIANGWNIVEDITANGAYDGNIVETPTDYYYKVANKNENGGYFANLAANVNAGTTSLSVDSVNVNSTDEFNTGDDIKNREAIIIYGQDTSGTFSLEGLPIGDNVVGGMNDTINFMGTETIANNYNITGPSLVPTKVVPAIMWYVEQKAATPATPGNPAIPADAIPWLYRNSDKVMPGVIGFQTSFGYDDAADGLEWYPAVPPASGTVDTLTVNNANLTTILKDLKAVRIVLTIRKQSIDSSAVPSMRTYEKTILLKN